MKRNAKKLREGKIALRDSMLNKNAASNKGDNTKGKKIITKTVKLTKAVNLTGSINPGSINLSKPNKLNKIVKIDKLDKLDKVDKPKETKLTKNFFISEPVKSNQTLELKKNTKQAYQSYNKATKRLLKLAVIKLKKLKDKASNINSKKWKLPKSKLSEIGNINTSTAGYNLSSDPKPENYSNAKTTGFETTDQKILNKKSTKKSSENIIGAQNQDVAIKKKHSLVSKAEITKRDLEKGLTAFNLGKSYGDKPAVRDVSIHINHGEAVGLLGPNGAGKTTSFYMIMGLVKPDYGRITLDGTDITKLPVYRRARLGIGYLPQEASIFRGLTVEENIMAVLEVTEPIAENRPIKLEELLAEFSISHLRRAPAVALSGGERRRVEIARCLAGNPGFILLDEPLAGIDPVAVGDIKLLILHLKKRGIGVLITDHNVREALDLLDRAYIIHNGSVLMEGTPKEIVANKEVRRVYLGETFVL